MEQDFLNALEASLGGMSKRQRAIAEYILDRGAHAAHETASALAADAGVSESTVVRFAVFMGYEGYPQEENDHRTAYRGRQPPR